MDQCFLLPVDLKFKFNTMLIDTVYLHVHSCKFSSTVVNSNKKLLCTSLQTCLNSCITLDSDRLEKFDTSLGEDTGEEVSHAFETIHHKSTIFPLLVIT
jgi:hypothetical protein